MTTARATARKAAGKTLRKTAAVPSAKAAAPAVKKPAAPAKAPAGAKVAATAPAPAARKQPATGDKPRKPKLVRDSFTIPKAEFAVIQTLKDRAFNAGAPAKKSELLRAGIKLLAAADDAAFIAALRNVPAIKTGRPSKT